MFDNLFDRTASLAFGITTGFMGYNAVWHKQGGDVSGKVHFKDPSTVVKIGDKEYDPKDGIMEFKRGDFVGLRELCDQNKAEKVSISMFGNTYNFLTVKDKKLFDGQTIQVKLMKDNGL